MVSLNSSLGTPSGVDPIAKVSPADAVKAVSAYPGYVKKLDGIVPHLNFYYDQSASKWRLVFLFEDVPVAPKEEKKAEFGRPRLMDYFVNADTGKVVAEVSGTPTMAQVVETAVNGKGASRPFGIDLTGTKKTMVDATLNVQTFDFKFKDPVAQSRLLPGSAIANPPIWPPGAVSPPTPTPRPSPISCAPVVKRNNIDNRGGPMNSSVNCFVARDHRPGEPPRQWLNAFWDGAQMVYGQKILSGGSTLSMSIDLDVVGHEMFHGVTDSTSKLAYMNQSGALNESYSDIFGTIIANFSNPRILTWQWEIGAGLGTGGAAIRDMSNPGKFGQPDNMSKFQVLPNTPDGDSGGVHTNSGIHNKAAYNVMTSVDPAGQTLFTAAQLAGIFYLALTQQLSATSQFLDSRRAVIISAPVAAPGPAGGRPERPGQSHRRGLRRGRDQVAPIARKARFSADGCRPSRGRIIPRDGRTENRPLLAADGLARDPAGRSATSRRTSGSRTRRRAGLGTRATPGRSSYGDASAASSPCSTDRSSRSSAAERAASTRWFRGMTAGLTDRIRASAPGRPSRSSRSRQRECQARKSGVLIPVRRPAAPPTTGPGRCW